MAERLWLTLENLCLFRETKIRADRESLVNDVGAAIRSSPLDADAILRATLSALGQGFRADRCCYFRYDQANDTAVIGTDDTFSPIFPTTWKQSIVAGRR